MNANIKFFLAVLITSVALAGILSLSGFIGKKGSSGVVDRHFIEQMIPHHEDAIAMAEIALTKGEHAEIKLLANNIKTSQAAENQQMRDWYKQWFGVDVPQTGAIMMDHGMMQKTGFHHGLMGDETDVNRLKDAVPFDKAFIEEMIPHHQMAIMMTRMLLGSTERPEMKKLGQEIIDAQTKEIDDMRSWYRAWYQN